MYRLRELELMYDGKISIMVQERVKWPKKIAAMNCVRAEAERSISVVTDDESM